MAATITTAAREQAHRRGRRRPVTAAVALAAVALVAACAEAADAPDAAIGADVGEFAATSDYLTGVAEATEGLTFRLSADMTMSVAGGGESFEMGGTIMTGEVDGDVSSITMDMGELIDDMAGQLPAGEAPPDSLLEGDLTMDAVTDGTTLYMRAPFFETMAEQALDTGASPSDLGPLGDLAALGDQWGRVDLSELSFTEVASATGAQASDPGVFLDMAARGTDVRELGTETIDGVDARGLGATITYGDMFEAQGIDADDFRDQIASSIGSMPGEDGEPVDQMFERIFAAEMPLEVWVDDEDRVRRIAFDIDMASVIADLAEEAGEDVGDVGASVGMVMDFTDYGDGSIEIEVPTDAVDITDEYVALLEGGGLGTGGSALGNT